MLLTSSRRRKHGRARFWKCSVLANSVISRLFFSWETEVFNKPIFDWGMRHARYLKPWFLLGLVFGLLLMVMMFCLMLFWVSSLLMDLWSRKTASEYTQVSGQVLTLVIPGLNMPWSDLPYMVIAITISVGFHELGHAIAAASEGVPIEHVAVFLACLVPGALVALNQESLQFLSPVRALRIYCAGIWHNVMCCAGCYLLLLLSQLVSFPCNVAKHYPMVSNIDASSSLAGHLKPGDSIMSVGGVQLQRPEDWFTYLYNHNNMEELAHFNRTSIANATAEESWNSIMYIASQGFCVCSKSLQKGENRLPGSLCADDALLFYQHSCTNTWPSSVNTRQDISCLKAVDVVECPPCSIKQNTRQSCSCPGSNLCLLPVLSHGEVFVGIRVQQSSLKHCQLVPKDINCERNLVYVGNVRVLLQRMQLTDYWPQRRGLLGFLCMLFWHLTNLLTYTFSLSAAMALLNSALVFHLDGEQMFQAGLVSIKSWVPPRRHKSVMQVVVTVGTILMALLLIFSFISLFS